MKEFQSQLEQILPVEELLFDATPGFGRFKPFLEQSIAHPAKMNTNLTEYLIRTLTKEGDVILDPMSGSGQTGVIAALLGRDAVCVELEEKFHKWQLEAKVKLEASQTLSIKGKMCCVLGDARELGDLLQSVDAVVTSPPYADGVKGPSRSPLWERMAQDPTSNRYGRKSHPTIGEGYGLAKDNIGNLPMGEIDAVITSPPYAEILGASHRSKLGDEKAQGSAYQKIGEQISKDNIGNLPMGEIDAIITSPPYSEGIGHPAGEKASEEHKARLDMQRKYTEQMASKGNIGSLKHGEVDVVIMSPPYAEANRGGGIAQKGYEGKYGKDEKLHLRHDRPISDNPDNISNMSFQADAVITSPPYEQSMEGGSRHYKKDGGHFKIIMDKSLPTAYSFRNKNQIGNFKKETYLQAMLTVYGEMFKVLKDNGQAIIIVKPFIRNKKVVDLPYQTWLLMQKCGFKLTKLFKLRLTQQSFWRILYQKKHPEVDVIAHEYVLVCRK